MIALAPGDGIGTGPPCDEAVPMGTVELGTASSQVLRSWFSFDLLDVYQEPAWLASRIAIASYLGGDCGIGRVVDLVGYHL
jgi:hypothetical protein